VAVHGVHEGEEQAAGDHLKLQLIDWTSQSSAGSVAAMSMPDGQIPVTTRFSIKYADIRSIFDEYGNPWFIAKDVCDYLGIEDASGACLRVWDDAKQKYTVTPADRAGPDASNPGISSSSGQAREMLVVSEPGLYQLVFMSRKPEADMFRRWVFYELLPQLRKEGQYRLHRSQRQLLPSVTAAAGKAYAGVPVTSTRFGRQPLLDVLRQRGLKNDDSFQAMNELELPGVPKFKTTYMDQARGKLYVSYALAARASAFLQLPVEELFTEASRARFISGLPNLVAANISADGAKFTGKIL